MKWKDLYGLISNILLFCGVASLPKAWTKQWTLQNGNKENILSFSILFFLKCVMWKWLVKLLQEFIGKSSMLWLRAMICFQDIEVENGVMN